MAPAAAKENVNLECSYTLTNLRRWSIPLTTQLPAVETIKEIHVYDFDNTLFKTPQPNNKLWNGQTIGHLAGADTLAAGGWWHNKRILAATGEGLEKEETRAWEGWWNEKMVELVKLSMRQKDALSVLMTGRADGVFDDMIKRMVGSRGLVFDMIVLKPKVGPSGQKFLSTMLFKQAFLVSLLETYRLAEDMRIYDDRPKHVKGFREFMEQYNQRQSGLGQLPPTRKPISHEVIQVVEGLSNLDPVVEVAEVQHLVNAHNELIGRGGASALLNPSSSFTRRPHRPGNFSTSRLLIKKTVFFTGYLISPADTQRLLALAPLHASLSDFKFHANNILICPRPCPQHILEKIGGMGARMTWEVTGTACFQDSVWAARLRPVPADAVYYTENPSPLVVLALRKGAKPMDAGRIREREWVPLPADRAPLRFETTVGEKMLLRIEAEDPAEDAYESLFPTKATAKRKHAGDDDALLPHHQPSYHQHQHQQQQFPTGPSAMTTATGGGRQRGGGGYANRVVSNQGAGRGGRGTPNRGNRAGGGGSGNGGNVRGGGGTMRSGGAAAARGGGRGGRGSHSAVAHYRSLDDPNPSRPGGGGGPAGSLDASFSAMYDDVPQPPSMPKAQQQQQQQQFQQRQQQRGRQRQQQGLQHQQHKQQQHHHQQHQSPPQPQHGFYQNAGYELQQQQSVAVVTQQQQPQPGQQHYHRQQQVQPDDQAYSMQWESTWEQMLMRKNQQQGGRPSGGGPQGVGDPAADLQSFY